MDKIAMLLREIGIPFAYDHFAEGESPKPPFICYRLPASDNFAADGMVYFHFTEVSIELYTDKKEPKSESKIEAALDAAGFFYNKTEAYIESEKLYEVMYTFETEV